MMHLPGRAEGRAGAFEIIRSLIDGVLIPRRQPAMERRRAVRDQSYLSPLSRGGLTVRKRRARRRAMGSSGAILVEAVDSARWSLDFVHDQLASGLRFRVLNVVDDVTRECLAAMPDTSISGRRVARELTALIERRVRAGMIVSDNGTELTSIAVLP